MMPLCLGETLPTGCERFDIEHRASLRVTTREDVCKLLALVAHLEAQLAEAEREVERAWFDGFEAACDPACETVKAAGEGQEKATMS